jgi:hypothetical protein
MQKELTPKEKSEGAFNELLFYFSIACIGAIFLLLKLHL